MLDNVKDYLPIGTVVLLKEGNKRLMVFGIIQQDLKNKEVEFDYIGVPYPEGNMGVDHQYLFQHKDVKEVYFRGYEDIERQEFIFNLGQYIKKQAEDSKKE